jgi:hypothetical protein
MPGDRDTSARNGKGGEIARLPIHAIGRKGAIGEPQQ